MWHINADVVVRRLESDNQLGIMRERRHRRLQVKKRLRPRIKLIVSVWNKAVKNVRVLVCNSYLIVLFLQSSYVFAIKIIFFFLDFREETIFTGASWRIAR